MKTGDLVHLDESSDRILSLKLKSSFWAGLLKKTCLLLVNFIFIEVRHI